MDEKRIVDTAAEPVDHQDDEFMDTGVLHAKPKGVRGQHHLRRDDDDEAEESADE